MPRPPASPLPAVPGETPPASSTSHVDALGTVGCLYLALVTIGFAAFRFLPTLPIGASRNQDRTFFTSVNAVTLTGFTQTFAAVGDYPVPGRVTLALLAVGGALLLIVGGGRYLRSVLDINVSTLRWVTVGIALVLWPLLFAPFVSSFDLILAGTGLGLGSFMSPAPWTRWLLVTASVPATLGPILLIWLLIGRIPDSRRLNLVACIVGCWAGLYLLGTLLLALLSVELGQGTPRDDLLALRTALADASLWSLNVRGLGTSLIGSVGTVVPAGQWLLMALMCIGAAPASVAGGLSLLPLVVLVGSIRTLSRGVRTHPIAGVAIAWVVGFALLVLVTLIALAATQPPLPPDRLLFIVLSAVSNVGLSHDPISLTGPALYILSAAMLAGRLLPLAMLCWMAVVSERERAGSDLPPLQHKTDQTLTR